MLRRLIPDSKSQSTLETIRKLLKNRIFGVCGFAAHPKNASSFKLSDRGLLHFYPYVLYFGMELILKTFDLVVGTKADAAGSVIGWYVFKIFVFAVAGLLLSGILYPIILKLEQTGNKIVPYMLFTTLNYPFEYAFFSLPILALQAENLPVIIRSPGFSYLVVILSSFFANYLRKTTANPYKDLRQRIYQEAFVRSISVFILVFMIIMISLLLKRFI